MTYASEVAADSPVLWWRLGESSGTTAVDASGSGRHGTYGGGPTLGASGLVLDGNTAVGFDGSDDYVSYSGTVLSASDATIEAWVTTLDTAGCLFDASGTSSQMTIRSNGSGEQWVVNATGSGTGAGTSSFGMSDGSRHHVVLTQSGNTRRLYVNGAAVASGAANGSINISSVRVASNTSASDFLQGVVDEFAIYGTELSAGRIAAHYAAGITASANEVSLDASIPPIISSLAIATSRAAHSDANLPSIVGALALDVGDLPNEMALDAQIPTVEGAIHVALAREVQLGAIVPSIAGGLVLNNVDNVPVRLDATMPGIVGNFALQQAVDSEVNRAGAVATDDISEIRVNPPVAPPTAAIFPQNIVAAQAYATPTIDGTQVLVEATVAREPAHRDRILINSRDVTYLRGVPTPTPDYQLIQPLLWGAATIELPQIAVPFEQPGYGTLTWLKPGVPVEIQRVDVDTNEIVATDYRGLVIAFGLNGGALTVECGGHASGRAAMVDRQMQLIQVRADARALSVQAIQHLGLRHRRPIGGTPTGIKLIRWGGGSYLDYINELVAKLTTDDGDQYALMPDAEGVYDLALRDLDTIHGTVYLDDARVKGDLRRDMSEEPNRIYASGITPDGMEVKFGAYPGLIQGNAAPYPMNSGLAFPPGTTDADTDTGDGITVMGWKLYAAGFLDQPRNNFDSYDTEMANAIRDLQRQAGLSVVGNMNLNTWRALWNVSKTGYSLRGIKILPAAQTSATMKWRLSSNGSQIARNPNFNPAVIPVDRTVSMGAGFTKSRIRTWARTLLSTGPVWRGTIELNLGAIVAGYHEPGDPITELLRDRAIQPGMNLWLPLFAGGIVVHVAGVSVTNGGRTVTLAVATDPGDTLPVWAAIQRDRDNRNTVHRSFFVQRRTTSLDRENTFDEVGGIISPIKLTPDNWTVFAVPAKQAGTIDRIRLQLSPAREFVVAAFARKISPARLRRVTNEPLTNAGRKRWTEESVYNRLNRDYVVLYVAGSDEDPCGYFPGRKTESDDLTGIWDDSAGFPFITYANETERGAVIWVAVWVGNDATLKGGRIMWPSSEDY